MVVASVAVAVAVAVFLLFWFLYLVVVVVVVVGGGASGIPALCKECLFGSTAWRGEKSLIP